MNQISIFDLIDEPEPPAIQTIVARKEATAPTVSHTGVRCYYSNSCKGHYQKVGDTVWVCTSNPDHKVFLDHQGCIAFRNRYGTTYGLQKTFESFCDDLENVTKWRDRL